MSTTLTLILTKKMQEPSLDCPDAHSLIHTLGSRTPMAYPKSQSMVSYIDVFKGQR